MLRDITIGQHFPGNSVVHRCDPRLKIIATIAYIIVLFMASNPLGIALSLALLALLYKVAQIPIKLIVKSLKPIVPIVLFTAVLNLFFITGEGEPLVHFGFIHIYREGVSYAVLMAVRIVALIAGTSLLTYTTSPIVLTDAIEALLKPFAKLHLPVHELAMMMTIALRFIPLLIDETEKIMNAQKAHGDTVRTITACTVQQDGELYTLSVTADGYLYNMVRILAGTVLQAGLGKMNPAAVPALLQSRNRSQAGPTLPARGLFLWDVQYPDLERPND